MARIMGPVMVALAALGVTVPGFASAQPFIAAHAIAGTAPLDDTAADDDDMALQQEEENDEEQRQLQAQVDEQNQLAEQAEQQAAQQP